VGGTVGCILAGAFATPSVNGNLNTNLKSYIGSGLIFEQLKAVGVTLVMAVVGTTIIAYALKAVLGLRPSAEAEEAGLDDTDHGEAGYHLDEGGGHGGLEDMTADAARAEAAVALSTAAADA
jgi:Amt family ammonium transporter